jgi:hypothetical protein
VDLRFAQVGAWTGGMAMTGASCLGLGFRFCGKFYFPVSSGATRRRRIAFGRNVKDVDRELKSDETTISATPVQSVGNEGWIYEPNANIPPGQHANAITNSNEPRREN